MQMPAALPRRLSRLPAPNRLAWLVAVALLAVLAIIGYQRWMTPAAPAVQGQQTPVRRGTIVQSVTTSGTTVSTRLAKLNFASGGRIKEVFVHLGDRVTAGQPIASLETTDLDLKLENARSAQRQAEIKVLQVKEGATGDEIAAAQAALEAAQTRYNEVANGPTTADVQDARSKLDQANASYATAKAKLDQLIAGPKADELASAQSQADKARIDVETAQAKLADLKAGPKADERMAAQTQVDSARESVKTAQAKLELLMKGGTNADTVAAESAVRTAQANLESALKKQEDLQRGPDPADVRQAKADVESAKASVKSAEAKLKASKDAKASSAQLRADQASIDAAESKRKAADASLAQVLAGPKPGDVAAAQTTVDTARANLASAQAKLVQLKVPDPKDVEQARSSVEKEQAGLRAAEAKLAVLLQGPTSAEVVAAQGAVDSATSTLEAAQAKLDQLTAGPDGNDVRAAQASVESARASVASAQAALNDLMAGAKPSDVQSAQSTLASAQAALSTKTNGPKETDLLLALEQVKVAELNVRQAELDVEDAILRAPFDGLIATINANPGEQAGSGATNQNSQSAQQSALVTVVDPRQVRVDANVDEVDVAKLTIGKSAEVTFEAVPGRRFRGQVTAVSPSGSNSQGVVTYPVSVNIDAPDDVTLPSGLTASVTVLVNRQADVLVVPSRAVRRQGRGDPTVEVIANGVTETRTVKLGLANDQQTEIAEGLAEGEIVIIPGTTTAPVRTSGGGFPGGGGVAAPKR
ncbi:MAG: efflux RND transporter periplasmic adaptor subunit [Chloroflexi bacterium]|nr:efflux RND transporter periplasmic adaptor subunit [Chloroflexota bacterium]